MTSSSSARCGLRAGYVELVNIDPKVTKYIYKLFSKDSCAPVLGQIVLDIMAKPPQPGDPSYPLYQAVRCLSAPPLLKSHLKLLPFCLLQEIQNIRNTKAHNLKRVSEVVNSLPGVTCQPVEGGAFAFPRVHFPPKAIQKAEVITQNTQKQSKSLFYYHPIQGHLLISGTGNETRHLLLYEDPGGGRLAPQSWL